MTLHLAPATYDALEDLASNRLDRALVLSRYAGGPMCVGYRPCLALVVDDVAHLVQFVLEVRTSVQRLRVDGDGDGDVLIADELGQLVRAFESGGVYTYQHTWSGGQTVYYWPFVHVRS